MNRRSVTITFIVLALIAAAIWGLVTFLSYHTVTLKIVPGDADPQITRQSDNKVITTKPARSIRLQNGTYCITATASKYTDQAQCFDVKGKNISVTFDPDYSVGELATLLQTEEPAIRTLIVQKYGAIISNYTIGDETLYKKGTWAAATLSQIVDPADRGDIYRVVFEKVDGIWQVAAGPAIALNKYDSPKVPMDVLDAVNNLVGNP